MSLAISVPVAPYVELEMIHPQIEPIPIAVVPVAQGTLPQGELRLNW